MDTSEIQRADLASIGKLGANDVWFRNVAKLLVHFAYSDCFFTRQKDLLRSKQDPRAIILYLSTHIFNRSSSSVKMFKRLVTTQWSSDWHFFDSCGINWADSAVGYSGLRLAQAARPSIVGASQRAFRPALSTGLKASAARFASSDSALHGKIHQVIGAVVDGRRRFFPTRSSFRNIKAGDEMEVQWYDTHLSSSQVRYRQASSDFERAWDYEWRAKARPWSRGTSPEDVIYTKEYTC